MYLFTVRFSTLVLRAYVLHKVERYLCCSVCGILQVDVTSFLILDTVIHLIVYVWKKIEKQTPTKNQSVSFK